MSESPIQLCVRVGLMGAVLLTNSAAQVQSLQQQREALGLIADFADRLCKEAPLTGSGTKVAVSGEAKAGFVGLLKRLADLNVGAAAEYQQQRYQGLVQADLLRALENGNKCRVQVFEDLKDRLVFGPSPSAVGNAGTSSNRPTATPAPKPGDANGWELLGSEDFTNPARDWAGRTWHDSVTRQGPGSLGNVRQEGGVLRVEGEFDKRLRKFDLPYPAALDIKLGLDVRFVPKRQTILFPLPPFFKGAVPHWDDQVGVLFARESGRELEYVLQRNGSYALTQATDDDSNRKVLEWVRANVTTSEWNRLEVEVVDQTVTLFLNGSIAAQYRDLDYRGGTVGYLVGAPSTSDISVEFDNFKLYRKRPSVR